MESNFLRPYISTPLPELSWLHIGQSSAVTSFITLAVASTTTDKLDPPIDPELDVSPSPIPSISVECIKRGLASSLSHIFTSGPPFTRLQIFGSKNADFHSARIATPQSLSAKDTNWRKQWLSTTAASTLPGCLPNRTIRQTCCLCLDMTSMERQT